MDYVARVGHEAIFATGPPERVGAAWDLFAEKCAEHGRQLEPGEGRAFHINVHVGRTTEEAVAVGGPGHDEYVKFLSPYGRFARYDDGNVPFDHCPTVEQTMTEEAMAIGSVAQVTDLLGRLRDRLDLRHLLLFPDFPGLSRGQIDEQMHLLAEEVLPGIGVTLTAA